MVRDPSSPMTAPRSGRLAADAPIESVRWSAWPSVVLATCLVAYLAAKLPIVLWDHGIYWPDEIYESLEMAHKTVFGYGIVPWEFVDGARNWAFPMLLTVPMRAGTFLVGDTPQAYLVAIRGCLVVLSLITAWCIYWSAVKLSASPLTASLAAGSFLLCALTLYFSHRALSEIVAQLPTLLGVVLLAQSPRSRLSSVIGAALLAVATILRLQLALVCVTVVAIEALRALRDRRVLPDLVAVLVTLSVGALVYGGLDAWSYGHHPNARYHGWFHSALVYLRFNFEGKASFWGTAPFYYYGSTLIRALEGLAFVLAAGVALSIKRIPAVISIVAVFIAAHSLVAHKELRFILPVFPLLFVAAAVGYSSLRQERLRTIAHITLLAATIASFIGHRSLTMKDLGAYPDRSADAAFDDFGPVNRLLLVLNTRSDVCGVQLDVPLSWAGGATYLHRAVPIYGKAYPNPQQANYTIHRRDSLAGGAIVAEDGEFVLANIGRQPCRTDPDYDWTLR